MQSMRRAVNLGVILWLAYGTGFGAENPIPPATADQTHGGDAGDATAAELGRRMYLDGRLPSGETMVGTVAGDVALSGEQVICGTCHRRSGMGSSEGQTVIPPVAGDILFEPLRLPTTGAPLAPAQRPAYTEASLKQAIRGGISADGKPLGPLMPRYPLNDDDLDLLISYLKGLPTGGDPGVTEDEIHFATIVAGSVPPATRKALIDVLATFIEQKNAETRHESYRAANAPWHKKGIFGPYRKWVLHVWDLEGPSTEWPGQLASYYREQPVFAVLSGVAPGPWRPIHDFCEQTRLPCLFPTTDLPVLAESDFYSVYLSKGMALEGEAIARHLADDGMLDGPIVQVVRKDDPRAATAADRLRLALGDRGTRARDFVVDPTADSGDSDWPAISAAAKDGVLLLWLDNSDSSGAWAELAGADAPARIYLSSTLFGDHFESVPPASRDRLYLVYPNELPDRQNRLLLRSTGWLRVKRIYAPDEKRVQANAYFALKMAGGAIERLHGYFLRDYLLERIEHMVDYAPYTSIYPRVSLAPGQRFVAKGSYIAKLSPGTGDTLTALTEWVVP